MASFITLPVRYKYEDQVDLIHKLLNVYSIMTSKLTPREIDLLTCCFLYDINDPDFKTKVINSKMGYNNDDHFYTGMSRLAAKGYIEKDSVLNKKYLNGGLKSLKTFMNSSNNLAIQLLFSDDEG